MLKDGLRMKSNTSVISWTVLVMAACSLFSMIGTLEIDGIINRDLYKYGLTFSYTWANPYWTTAGFVFAMGWLNIIIALGYHVRTFYLRLETSEKIADETEEESIQVKAVEQPAEQPKEQPKEEAKPTEAEEKPKDVQIAVIDTNAQEGEEKQVEVKEVPTQVKSEAERVEEKESQQSPSPQQPENQQETKSEPQKEDGETPLPQSAEP
jgi:hypothetical protein